MPRNEPAASAAVSDCTSDKIVDALTDLMRSNPRILLLSPETAPQFHALLDEFGSERVRSETSGVAALTAVAIGAARCGYRPVVNLESMDELALALEPLAVADSKRSALPLVIRLRSSDGLSAARRPSWEAWFAHMSGVNVAVPATLEDACSLLQSALRDGTSPTVIIEHDRIASGGSTETDLQFGRAAIRRPGNDLSVVAYGRAAVIALQACKIAAEKHNIDAESIDLRTIAPVDLNCVLASLKKTGRVLLCADAPQAGSFVSELALQIVEQGFDELDAPVRRVVGVNLSLDRILSAIRELSVE